MIFCEQIVLINKINHGQTELGLLVKYLCI
jgi:hypothetical protein